MREELEKLNAEAKPKSFPYRGKSSPTIKLYFPELTWKCPLQAYPDFAKFYLTYIPKEEVVELKSLKLWLNTYRDKYIGHEKIADEIFDTLWELMTPKEMELRLDINPRGNLKSEITIKR